MSTRELRSRDDQKDSVALTVGTTLVGAFLVGTLLWWPGAAITLVLGVFATTHILRK